LENHHYDSVIVTYDITSLESFNKLKYWFSDLKKKDCANDSTVIMLVGTKLDLEDKREVKTEWGKNIADQHSCMFMKTSALANINVDEAINMVVRKAHEIKLGKVKDEKVETKKNEARQS